LVEYRNAILVLAESCCKLALGEASFWVPAPAHLGNHSTVPLSVAWITRIAK
jgi:hypothetical protein